MRGPAVLPGPYAPVGVPRDRSGREDFDALVLGVVRDLEGRWRDELGLVEFAVEDTPVLPEDWAAATVPLATVVRGHGSAPTRLVVFRRPIELRAGTRADLSALVLTVLVEQVAELLGRPPEDVDPRYEGR